MCKNLSTPELSALCSVESLPVDHIDAAAILQASHSIMGQCRIGCVTTTSGRFHRLLQVPNRTFTDPTRSVTVSGPVIAAAAPKAPCISDGSRALCSSVSKDGPGNQIAGSISAEPPGGRGF